MNKEQFKGFVRLSLAHHPTCWQYRLHTIRIKNVAVCLGCTGFYSGMIIVFLFMMITGLHRMDWEILVLLASIFFLPTILRLLKIKPFISKQRKYRFVFRWLLGAGVTIGLFSIFSAPNRVIGLLQIVLGISLYAIISLKRIRSGNFWEECQDCSFNPSSSCPGFEPFYLPRRSTKKELMEKSEKESISIDHS